MNKIMIRKRKICSIWLLFVVFLVITYTTNAQFQLFFVPKDDFSRSLYDILNDAPRHFKNIKGKRLDKSDASKSTVYQCRKKLQGLTDKGKIIIKNKTSSICSFSLGVYTTYDDAEASFVKMNNRVSTALYRKVIIHNEDSINIATVLRQTKIGYRINKGFYDFNIILAIQKSADTTYQVTMNILGGEPNFFNLIPKNQPFNSSLFKTTFSKLNDQFQQDILYDCHTELAGFMCEPPAANGETQIAYSKFMEDQPHALYEFRAIHARIKSCLGQGYIFTNLPANGSVVQATEYIRQSDFVQTTYKKISLSLVKVEDGFEMILKFIHH